MASAFSISPPATDGGSPPSMNAMEIAQHDNIAFCKPRRPSPPPECKTNNPGTDLEVASLKACQKGLSQANQKVPGFLVLHLSQSSINKKQENKEEHKIQLKADARLCNTGDKVGGRSNI